MPSAATISAERTKPVRRETIVPAAITALDFSRPEAFPLFLGAAAGAGAVGVSCIVASDIGAGGAWPEGGAGDGPGTAGESVCGRPPPWPWSRKRCAKASGSWCSSPAPVTRSSTPTNWVVRASSP